MTNRERFRRALFRQPVDRVPRCDISFWPETKARWEKEGLPEGANPAEYFGLDPIGTTAFDNTFGLPRETLEEADNYVILRDGNGVTKKRWTDHWGAPHVVEYTLNTREDWHGLRERLVPDLSRIPDGMADSLKQRQDADAFVCLSPRDPCWFCIEAMGYDHLLMHMASDPEWVREMFEVYTDYHLGMCELCVGQGMRFDGHWMFSDLCYKGGMLFSPAMFREFLTPLHKRIKQFCRENDIPMVLHCDGYVGEFIPLLIEVGYDAIQPLEARARNDVREYKKAYGTQICFFGNISADVMSTTREAIEEEVRTKLLAAKEGGGYIYHTDHSVPPGVSFENYAYVIELVKQHGRYD